MNVSILLSTYNGERYLKSQLDSLFAQTYKDIRIIVRDDGSVDNTLDILKSYDITLVEIKNNLGAKESFSYLLDYSVKNTNSEYFMFCDQDDVWEDDKIAKTLAKMQDMEKKYGDIPLLVHTDLKVVDEYMNTIDGSFWNHEFISPQYNSLNRLLMQNTITGCTVMINRNLAELVSPMPTESIMHDWWIGLVASKFGKIAYIDESLIKYRQHDSNSIGVKGFNYLSVFMKFYKIFYKNELYLRHLNINIQQAKIFLEIYKDKLDAQTKDMLKDFTTIEDKSFWEKRKILLKHKLLKQGLIRNIGLLVKI